MLPLKLRTSTNYSDQERNNNVIAWRDSQMVGEPSDSLFGVGAEPRAQYKQLGELNGSC